MNKEKFIEKVFGMFNPDDYRIPNLRKYFDEFFDSNICIPKGENRHPSSDVLHMAIEGVKIQGWNHIKNEWEDDTSWFIDKNDLDYPTKYRIKPLEPVYEWQWKFKRPETDEMWNGYTIYATEDEFKVFQQDWMVYEKDESTKRERK